MNRIFYLVSLLLFTFSGFSQVNYSSTNWAFGIYATLKIDQNGVQGVSKNKLKAYSGSASYSNKNGELILATNGNAVYGKNDQLIATVDGRAEDAGNADAIIIPKNDNENEFYIFTLQTQGLAVIDVDLSQNSARLRTNRLLNIPLGNKITAVKHCFSDAYWLIVSDATNKFYSFLVKPNKISEPVISIVGRGNRLNLGDLVSNHKGDMLALSNYSDDWVEIYDFDKRCGEISNARNLRKLVDTDDRPHGLCFAPDDKSIFVAWSYKESRIAQYDLENWGSISNAFTSQQNINDIELGNDNRLYINVHESNIPSRRIHRINQPNIRAGGGTRAIFDVATLPAGTNGSFEFPTFIHCYTGGSCNTKRNQFDIEPQVNRNRCTNKQVYFDFPEVEGMYDSILWIFDDPGSSLEYSNEYKIKKQYINEGNYKPYCVAYYCQLTDTFFFNLDMVHPPVLDLGKDTTLCPESTMQLTLNGIYDTIFWSDGSSAQAIEVSLGEYSVKVYKGWCFSEDTINIEQYPDIWTELKSEYYICDIENEATKLDAGKGFNYYKWTPTGDTTQWIIVSDLGNYMVVVEAFTGCLGEGKTIVQRRCDLTYHIPNSFSPNGDGINDRFEIIGTNIEKVNMKIFNRWGELIHSNESENEYWDGNNSPVGNYLYQVEIIGYQNKKPITRREKGILQLIK